MTYDEVARAAAQNLPRLDAMELDGELRIGPDETIEDLIPLAAASGHPVAVVAEEGRLVGEVPHHALFLGMMGEENGQEIARLNGDNNGES